MDGSQQTHDTNPPGTACSVPLAWLQERATFYRARAEERPNEYHDYRRMAWACGVVQEIWKNWIEERAAENGKVEAREK